MARLILAGAIPVALLAACSGDKAEKVAQADAKAAAFVPPSVTSRLDYGSAQQRRFASLDRDGNGIVTRTELPATNSRLAGLDRNRDGQITASEFSEGTMARFDAMDLNKDGSLTSDERADARGSR